ncbi:methylamine utilization protein MauG [Amylibacter marinus]|uniref:Methylamine utilization protein MauG n=1 Tax=Amylibacter marinus TaxID=1475483 RepID=A0ABQ5VTX6_9RHOB|nr:cytochrome c peroxidase [Amylibacter marinus]GLQ34721.1 methylamine utilization protein MauG [Amylibacter marinus]
MPDFFKRFGFGLLLGATFIYLLGFSYFAPKVENSPESAPQPQVDIAEVQVSLGRNLFFDPILSGSKEISCATCHGLGTGSSDGLSLGFGDGAVGVGMQRRVLDGNIPKQRIPRNAPALYNLADPEFSVVFHDGRLSIDETSVSGFNHPLGAAMPAGVQGIAAAQAFLPVLAEDEMAGHDDENEISRALRPGTPESKLAALQILADRVQGIKEYADGFAKVNGEMRDLSYVDIANAIGAYIEFEFRADNSPFDHYIQGEAVFNEAEYRGFQLFYGEAGCSDCHSGAYQTDHKFHAIAMPQFGPGKGQGMTLQADLGRGGITRQEIDNYRFLTPSLRNIALTAPYGHTGAYSTLQGIIRHHLDPVTAFRNYQPNEARMVDLEGAGDWRVMEHLWDSNAIAMANELGTTELSDTDVNSIEAFLHTLTDPISQISRLGAPVVVPSGLPINLK